MGAVCGQPGGEPSGSARATASWGVPGETLAEGVHSEDGRAAAAFRGAAGEGDDRLRLEISPAFGYDLYFGPSNGGDIEVTSNGVALRFDAASAARADGLSIDFVDGPGGGFKIVSPHEPARVKSLTAVELKRMLDAGTPLELFDVRTVQERQIAVIPSARLLDSAGEAHLRALDKNSTIVFHCHHGVRSQSAAQRYLSEGFRNVFNLEGGIDAWSAKVDPTVARH